VTRNDHERERREEMRNILFQMMISVDGFFEGPNRELDWHVVDEEFINYAVELLDSVDAILFGRVTYQMMAAYWQTPTAIAECPIVAEKMNSLPKFVFSPTLEKVEWQNTTLVKGNIAGEVAHLKQKPGKDMVIFGSSDLAVALTKLGMIDEYRIIVNPVVLGSGKTLLEGFNERLRLTLIDAKTFSSGNVLLRYRPAKE
jgi:dihydrofolate reductase